MRTPPLVFRCTFFMLLGIASPGLLAFSGDLPLAPSEGPPLILGLGEQRLLNFQGLKRYSVGSESIRAHSPGFSNDSLLIKGVREGYADLWVWKSDGSSEHRSIQVQKLNSRATPSRLDKALARLLESEILISGEGVILRGLIHSHQEAARVAALRLGFPKEIRDETEASGRLLEEGQKKLEGWIQSSPHREHLKLENLGSTLRIRGFIEAARDRQILEQQIRATFPRTEIDLESLPDQAPTIHFKVFLLEIRRNQLTSLGLTWPPSQPGAFRVSTWGIQESLQLDLTLQALEAEGSAKVLSKPELVVRAPGEAELFAGGEIPIQTKTQYSSNVTWRQFGLILRLHVTHTAGNHVRLEIFTEVSHLDPNINTDSLPGLQANRMKTQVDARFGSPLLLSGLLQDNVRKQARGLPFLRSIPVLGHLFGSEDYLNDRSELVAILLPQATPPDAPMDRVERMTPRGPVPMPRNWIPPEKEHALRADPEYPWNALK